MAISADDLPSASLPEETSSFGDATALERQKKAIESAGVGRRTMPGAPGGASGGPVAGGPPSPGAPVQPPPSSALPGVAQQQLRAPEQAITMRNLFQQAPQLQEPWRTWLRRQAGRPGAGPEMQALADAIEHQRGPLDGPPKQ